MTMQDVYVDDPDKLHTGDVVTIVYGEEDQPGYQCITYRIGLDYAEGTAPAQRINNRVYRGFRIARVQREVTDLPSYGGALALTNQGVALSTGTPHYCWTVGVEDPNMSAIETSDLVSPVPAVPVPIEELTKLYTAWLAEMDDTETYDAEIAALMNTCTYEWDRAGIPVPWEEEAV